MIKGRENEMGEIEIDIDIETESLIQETGEERGPDPTAMNEKGGGTEIEIINGDIEIDSVQIHHREAHRRTGKQRKRSNLNPKHQDSDSTHRPRRKTSSRQ